MIPCFLHPVIPSYLCPDMLNRLHMGAADSTVCVMAWPKQIVTNCVSYEMSNVAEIALKFR